MTSGFAAVRLLICGIANVNDRYLVRIQTMPTRSTVHQRRNQDSGRKNVHLMSYWHSALSSAFPTPLVMAA